jgi:hypothetical protein
MVLDFIGGRSLPESVIGPSLRLTYVRQLRLKSLIDELADLGKVRVKEQNGQRIISLA